MATRNIKTETKPAAPRAPRFFAPHTWHPAVKEWIEHLVETNGPIETLVLPDPTDVNRKIIMVDAPDNQENRRVAWIMVEAGWFPGFGKRKIIIRRTRRGSTYASPADPKSLPEGEDQRDKSLRLRCLLAWDDREDRPILLVHSGGPAHGMRLAIEQRDLGRWRTHAKPLARTGRLIDVLARPARTTYVAKPVDWAKLEVTAEATGHAAAEALRMELRAEGLFTFAVEQPDGTDADYQFRAPVVLGIGPNDPTTKEQVRARLVERLRNAPLEFGDMVAAIPGLTPDRYNTLLREARAICDEMAEAGTESWGVAIEADDNNEGILTEEEVFGEVVHGATEAYRHRGVRCPSCSEDNLLDEQAKAAPRERQRCKRCGHLLHPFTFEELMGMTLEQLDQVMGAIDQRFVGIRPKPPLVALIRDKQ